MRLQDAPRQRVYCIYCGSRFNADPQVDDSNLLKRHEGYCAKRSSAEREFYRKHRRWPGKDWKGAGGVFSRKSAAQRTAEWRDRRRAEALKLMSADTMGEPGSYAGEIITRIRCKCGAMWRLYSAGPVGYLSFLDTHAPHVLNGAQP